MTVERREVSGFDRVRFRGPGVLKIVQGKRQGLTIHAPGWIMDDIESDVVDGELKLGYGSKQIIALRAHREIMSFTLELEELSQLRCTGVGGRVLVPDLDSDEFKVTLSGQGHLIFEHLTADSLSATISGAGVVQVKGDVETQRIRIDGAGQYKASALVSDFAVVRISGAGTADVSASAELDVQISGAGQVSYDGYPEISRAISGVGRLLRRRRREPVPMNGEDHGG